MSKVDEAKAAVRQAQQQLETAKAEERAALRAHWQKQREESARRERALRDSLEEEFGMKEHPKRDALWSKAWEHGHAGGESDVRFWYADLIELVS